MSAPLDAPFATSRASGRVRSFLPPLLAFVLLAGCGTPVQESQESQESPPPQAPTTSAPDSTDMTAEPDDGKTSFLLNVRHSPDYAARSDDDLLAAAEHVCSALDEGATYDEAVAPVVSDGATEESALLLAASAVFSFCPEHDPVIEVAMGGPSDPQETPEGDERSAYIERIKSDPYYAGFDDEGLLMLGTTYCDGFTRGDSREQSLDYLSPIPEDSALLLLHAAVDNICPEHAGKL